MPYINLENLTLYDELIKAYGDAAFVRYGEGYENWQKTEAAASVTFYAAPGTPVEPVVTFAFAETDPVEGDKAPDNPSAITGVSSVTITHCASAGVDETDYTVDLGGTCYGGSLDVASGTLTITHVMVEPNSLSYDVSAHPANTGDFDYTDTFGRTVTTDGNTLTISDVSGGKIVYNLASPETVSLTPVQILSLPQADSYTPRLNTVSTDAESVKVGYVKSAIRTEYELTQAIIATEGGE